MANRQSMRGKPAVIMIGADKGGVGKTTASRLFLDYLRNSRVATRAYDTEYPKGNLQRFFPSITEIVDITSVADQMRILDSLETSHANVSVIDIRAGLLSQTLAALEEIGFLDAARDGQFTLDLVHVLGSSIASLSEIADIVPYMEGNRYILARNFINDTNFFEWDAEVHKKYFSGLEEYDELCIPKLHEMAYEQVDIAGVPFSTFIENLDEKGDAANYSFVLRGYVSKWLKEVHYNLDSIYSHEGKRTIFDSLSEADG